MSRERGSLAARVVAQFCGLFISVLYRQHGFLSYGYARAPTLSKDLDDTAILLSLLILMLLATCAVNIL